MAKKKKKKKKNNKRQPQKEQAKIDLYEMGYLEEGTEIGDDGLPMTRARKSMQRLLTGLFIWAIIAVALGIFALVLSYTENQTNDLELNGYEFTMLLQIEGIFCFFSAVVAYMMNITGLHWLYGQSSSLILNVLTGVLGVVSLIYELAALFVVNGAEPAAFVNLILIINIFSKKQRVDMERPILEMAQSE